MDDELLLLLIWAVLLSSLNERIDLMSFKVLLESFYSLGFSLDRDLVEFYQPRRCLRKTFHLTLPDIKLLPNTLETKWWCLSQPKKWANTLFFLNSSQALSKAILGVQFHLLSVLLLPLFLCILGINVWMGLKKVHDLFGCNLLAECWLDTCLCEYIKAHIREFPLWCRKLLQDFLVELAIGVRKDPEICLNNNKLIFVLFLYLTGISALG